MCWCRLQAYDNVPFSPNFLNNDSSSFRFQDHLSQKLEMAFKNFTKKDIHAANALG